MKVLKQLLKEVGGKILWRTEVFGQVVCTQDIDEVLGIWYPSHQAFLNLMTAPSSAKNMKLRDEAVAKADLPRCKDYAQSWQKLVSSTKSHPTKSFYKPTTIHLHPTGSLLNRWAVPATIIWINSFRWLSQPCAGLLRWLSQPASISYSGSQQCFFCPC